MVVALLTALISTLQQCMIMVSVSNFATKFFNVLRMSNICHLDVRIQVLLQNLFQNVCIEAKPNPWLGEYPVLHPEVELKYLTQRFLACSKKKSCS